MQISKYVLLLACVAGSVNGIAHAQVLSNAANNAGYIAGTSLYNNGRTGSQIYYSPSTGANYGDPTQGAINFMTGQQNIYGAVQSRQQDFRNQNQSTDQQSNQGQNASQPVGNVNSTADQNSSSQSGQADANSPKVMSADSLMDQAMKNGDARVKSRLDKLQKERVAAEKKEKDASGDTSDIQASDGKSKITYFSGKAYAMDGITLSVGGKQIILNDIKAPGNNQQCYHSGVPWGCGKAATEALNTIVSSDWVNCATEDDGHGICEINGQDVSYTMASTGFAVGTTPYTEKASNRARSSQRGLWK